MERKRLNPGAGKRRPLKKKVLNANAEANKRDRNGLSITLVTRVLLKTHGVIAEAARVLKVNYSCLYNFVERHPELHEVRKQARTKIVDIAETELYRQIRNGNMSAIMFTLRCHGEPRGWVEKRVQHHQFSSDQVDNVVEKIFSAAVDVIDDPDKLEELAKRLRELYPNVGTYTPPDRRNGKAISSPT